MEMFTISHLLVCSFLIAVIMPAMTMPATLKNGDVDGDEESLLVVPYGEEEEVVPTRVVAQKVGDGDDMETANTRYYPQYYYYRPVYTYRRTQSNRRRVYTPRRRVSYDSGDRFPTVA